MDAFSRRLGLGQGRVELTEGRAVFVLGELEPGYKGEFTVGDFAQVAQTTDLSDIDLIRVQGDFRIPNGPQEDPFQWEVSITIDGEKKGRVLGLPGRARPLNDLAADVSKMVGPHEVAIRLELVDLAHG